jgi:hypothetical protein
LQHGVASLNAALGRVAGSRQRLWLIAVILLFDSKYQIAKPIWVKRAKENQAIVSFPFSG